MLSRGPLFAPMNFPSIILLTGTSIIVTMLNTSLLSTQAYLDVEVSDLASMLQRSHPRGRAVY